MSADKRKISTDALETLGTIIGPEEKRDAIHLACIPIRAPTYLVPGEHVNSSGFRCPPYATDAVGIVDPFLRRGVEIGEWFWLIIYPRKITSLRHVWSHPAFEEEEKEIHLYGLAPAPDKAKSEEWLRNFIKNADCPDYETVIAKALDNRDSWSSEYLHFIDRDAHGDIPPEFWDHLEVVTGRKILEENRAKYFSCSC